MEFSIGLGSERGSWQFGAARRPVASSKGADMNKRRTHWLQQYGLPFGAVIAGHVFLLWALIKGLAMAAPQPPEVVVMASIISAPVVAPEMKAEPAPPKPQPKPQLKEHKPQPLAIKPKLTAEKPAERVVAPAPEKVASAPIDAPKESKTEVASGAPTKGEEVRVEVKVPPTLVGASSDLSNDYPALSQRLGEEGTVVLLLRVSTDGSVAEASLVKSSGYQRLDAQALKAARAAHFKPGTSNGQPVPMSVKLPIKYELR